MRGTRAFLQPALDVVRVERRTSLCCGSRKPKWLAWRVGRKRPTCSGSPSLNERNQSSPISERTHRRSAERKRGLSRKLTYKNFSLIPAPEGSDTIHQPHTTTTMPQDAASREREDVVLVAFSVHGLGASDRPGVASEGGPAGQQQQRELFKKGWLSSLNNVVVGGDRPEIVTL